ncbi:MAG: phosphoribosyltransferase [Chloroflexi bacterium]|nr:phosphoribosyltransferase [Chloroflexota bacterium]
MGTLRIISRSGERFDDRREAGQLVSRELLELRGQNAVVLGIPRGGIVIAREMAQALEADLDIVLARKLRSPGHEELAMGSVAEGGQVFLNDMVIQELGVTKDYIEKEKARQMAEIARRAEMIRKVRPKVPLEGRTVVVTDDGVATGATLQAALWAARHEQPKRIIAAMPVGSEDTVRRLAEDADEMLCLRAPPFFVAVGQFYVRFEPVEDEDVLEILKEESLRKVGK